MLSNKQKTLAIVAFKQLGISEEDRHRIQKEVGGHRSLTKMSYNGWLELVRHLGDRGFKNRSPFTVHRSPQRTTDNPGRSGLISKIYVLWYQLAGTYYTPGKEKAALRGFLRKRFRVDHENFLDTPTAIKVIEAIKSILKRNNVIWD
jgi:hypothetical protein